MKFEELIINLEKREGKRKSYDFKRMKALLQVLDNPHKNLKYLHVAGTNGKGSVSNFLYNILLSGGYEVGLYTSPHLERYTERIVVSGKEISKDDFTRIGIKVIEAEKFIVEEFEMLTYFEAITAMAFIYFKEKKCQYCVLEVGMGGLSDSTNVVDAEDKILSLITPIAKDHMQYLGNTIEEITVQKAGIIKRNTLCVTSNTDEKVLKIIRDKAKTQQAPYLDLSSIEIEDLDINDRFSRYSIKYGNEKLENLEIRLVGYYQLENSAISVLSILELRRMGLVKISDDAIRQGLKNTFWAGRMETVNLKPRIILDGAHNYNGITRLVENFKLFNYKKLYIISSILSDKEHEKMLGQLAKYADQIVLVSLHTKRKTDLDLLKAEAKKYCKEVFVIYDLDKAIQEVLKRADTDDMIVISGSLYLVSEMKEIIRENLNII